jgi:hypothetical protein
MNLECAVGNGRIQVGGYPAGGLVFSDVAAELRKLDEERGCTDRVYSTSRASGIESAQRLAADFSGPLSDMLETCLLGCDESIFSRHQYQSTEDYAAHFLALTNDAVAVFSSEHDLDGDDDPVGCFYYRYFVFRANGTAIHFEYDYSD